jgi:hypothetical protein
MSAPASPEPDTQQVDQQPLPVPARLGPVPDALVETRLALHRLAEEVVSPARSEATGRIGLRATPGGFGTPTFGDGQQVRVEATDLVRVERCREQSRVPLEVDAAAAALLADWFAFGASVLLELRAGAGDGADASLVQLWPEHFDIAVELGSEATGARANYGFSPGDDDHREPYAYVGPWLAPPPGELWQASGFPGAELPYSELSRAANQAQAALDFLRARLAALSG